VLRGKLLQEFKLGLKSDDVNDIDVVNQAPQLGVFNFRFYLNLAMLLTESEKAKTLRSVKSPHNITPQLYYLPKNKMT
jgi:hypothetical protein